MFEYDFMLNAFAAGTVVAVVAGLVGYVLVLRGQAFAGHALGHLGFSGATGAALLGWPPLPGLVAMTVLGGIGMGLLGERAGERDVAIGVVLSASLGLGLLFLHFYTGQAASAAALLFGNLLGVEAGAIWGLLALGVAALLALGAMLRPLLFATLQPELAEARGVPMRPVSVAFLAVAALAVSLCAQVVGVLLVFTLLVAPAAAAQRLARGVAAGMALSAALAVGAAWGGLALSYWTDWPPSVGITALSTGIFALAALSLSLREREQQRLFPAEHRAALLHEGGPSLPVVRAVEAGRHRRVHRRHVPRARVPQRLLDHQLVAAYRQRRVAGDAPGQGVHRSRKLRGRHHAVHQADPQRLRGGDALPGQ